MTDQDRKLSIAIIGAGITGLSAAWLLGAKHAVTLYESDQRLGGHANTVTTTIGGEAIDVDTGFIVYNEANYPNFTALLKILGVETRASDMSFAVSRRQGATEYSSNDWASFLGNGRNLLKPRFWAMSWDLVRFYRTAAADIAAQPEEMTLGAYLDLRGYGSAFQDDHLIPEAAAIWSSSVADMRDYPARAFIRFFENHGLLRFSGRPRWRTIVGGSRAYVSALRAQLRATLSVNNAVVAATPAGTRVDVKDATGAVKTFDRVLITTHADQALRMLAHADNDQRAILSAIPYRTNKAVLHTDTSLMPKHRGAWSSWNYVEGAERAGGCAVTYWMNRLQGLDTPKPLFVTLNPARMPAPECVLWQGEYDHPCFSPAAMQAQKDIWALQGRDGIWFAGAWLGAGFHEDGLQAGLAAAERMGGVRRPWIVPHESGRLSLGAQTAAKARAA